MSANTDIPLLWLLKRQVMNSVKHSKNFIKGRSLWGEGEGCGLALTMFYSGDLASHIRRGGEEKSDSPFVSTLSPPSRTDPGMKVFQQASGSPDQAYPEGRSLLQSASDQRHPVRQPLKKNHSMSSKDKALIKSACSIINDK